MALLDPTLHQLLSDLLTEAHGTSKLPEALKLKMIDDLAIQLEQYTHDHVVNLLSTKDQTEFYRLLSLPAEDEGTSVQQFLVAHIPHYDQELSTVFARFKADYIATCQA